MPATERQSLSLRVHALVEEILGQGEVYIVEVLVRGQQGSRVVEVYVDTDEGIGLDELARISRELDFLLETEEVIRGRYVLNVSSPGADRPLTNPRQFRRHLGREMRVTVDQEGEPRHLTGTMAEIDDDAVTLTVNGTPEILPFAAISEARVLLPW